MSATTFLADPSISTETKILTHMKIQSLNPVFMQSNIMEKENVILQWLAAIGSVQKQ